MTNLKYEVFINGNALSEISEAIFISGIQYKPAEVKMKTAELAGLDGERVESRRHKGASVNVLFYLKKVDMMHRQRILEQVAGWAADGVLQTSDRPGRQLRVRCVGYPSVEDACEWTKPAKITFQTFENPYWEERSVASLTLSGTNGNGKLYIPGNAGNARVEATISPTGSANNITLNVGDTSIALTGVGATSSQPVTISYDENGFLKILRGTTSMLSKRTGSDDLIAECGKSNSVSFTANAACSVTFSARGLWR